MSGVAGASGQPASSNDWDALQDSGQPYGKWGNQAFPRPVQSGAAGQHPSMQMLLRVVSGDDAAVEGGGESGSADQPDFLSTLLFVLGQSVAAAQQQAQLRSSDGEDDDLTPPFPWHLFRDSNSGLGINRHDRAYDGRGVVVGVIDTGFHTEHDVLRHVTLADKNMPLLLNEDGSDMAFHGTAVASLIFGWYPGTCSTIKDFGAAPRAIMAPFPTPLRTNSLKEDAKIHERAVQDVDVLNFSWGLQSIFGDSVDNPRRADPSFLEENSGQRILESFKNATENGRDGKGVILVTSAGNSRRRGDDINTHDLKKSPYVIAVGAIDKDGNIAPFSTGGAAVFVVAPGDEVPVAVFEESDADGVVNNSYYEFHGGTSFAAPLVSGVVASILQANPQLGWRDVHEILAAAAFPVHLSDTTWAFNGATDWNGGGRLFSNDYGFGLVDHHASVRLAETWFLGTDSSSALTAESLTNVKVSMNLRTWYQGGTCFNFVVPHNLNIERVLVDLPINIQNPSNIKIELVSPSGARSTLLNRLGRGFSENGIPTLSGGIPVAGSDDEYIDWKEHEARFRLKLLSNMFRGENSQGNWQLVITTNNGSQFISDDKNIVLNFFGGERPSVRRFIFTDAFSEVMQKRAEYETFAFDLSAMLWARDLGAIDVVNVSAVTSNVIFDLKTGGIIDGVNVSIRPGLDIEHFAAGDGNDVVFGTEDDNLLWLGRGDDVVYLRGGSDIVYGGTGRDTVFLPGKREIWQVSSFDLLSQSIVLKNRETGDRVSLHSVEKIVFNSLYQPQIKSS